ncbi:MAG: hypothetical protein NTV87_12655 [Ignavibacteriae bacterium]|nr:hypothetical protein [Ignavibacteriota bacterium]
MDKLIEINWNNFRAKFNGKEQKTFEWLCYILFCKEFNKPTGLLRYKNQTGIETEPIEVGNILIGFQSKFYETSISKNKDDIIDSIKKTKSKNPQINKILFYLNQEFSESSKKTQKEPKYKTDIYKCAKSVDVEIEWRVPSHFEIQLSVEENLKIAQHFFSLEKSIIDFIDSLKGHTELIFSNIYSNIKYNGNEIKIDRSNTIGNLIDKLNKSSLVIISGKAGVGKSAILKDFFEIKKDDNPFFIFKASEFNISNLNQFISNYGNFSLTDFIDEYININNKYIVIDSAEKISDLENTDVLHEFISSLIKNNWKIILTTRHNYLNGIILQFGDEYNRNMVLLNVDYISKEELINLSHNYNFELPKSERFANLLEFPFYLKEYLKNYNNLINTVNYSDFKRILWEKQISKTDLQKNNVHIKREECFLKIAQNRANHGNFFVKAPECEGDILHSLEIDEIIKYDSTYGGYFITHDIYEEWALDKIIERSFLNFKDTDSFLKDIGNSFPVRRAFRNWLSEKLLADTDKVIKFIDNSIYNDSIESYWKDEILVSVLLSDYSSSFFDLFKDKLLEDEQKLLKRIAFLLRIACKEIDEDTLKLLGLQSFDSISIKALFTKPKGSGWDHFIDFIYKHKEEFGILNINAYLPILYDWNNIYTVGVTTKKTGQIALFYYQEIINKNVIWYESELKKQLIRVILRSAFEVKKELIIVFDEILSKNSLIFRDNYYDIVKTILTSIVDNTEVIKCLPEYVLKLADLFWYNNNDKKNDKGNRFNRDLDIEQYFGISIRHLEYFPASAYQTPIYRLLNANPKITIDFILSFVNKTVDNYSKSKFINEIEEIEIYFEDNSSKKQFISHRLWNMYRGTQVSTHLLESIHMALEKWLLEIAKIYKKETLESICLNLIKNSKSASITAIVVSIVLAYPYKLFNIAKILFRTKEFFFYDTSRMILDQSSKSYYSIGFSLDIENKFFQDERIKGISINPNKA